MVDGGGRGRGEHSCVVGPILAQISGAEAGTEGEALGEVFLRMAVEAGVAVDLD